MHDISKNSLGDIRLKRRTSLQPLFDRKTQEALRKLVDELVDLFVEAQNLGKDDNKITQLILDHIVKKNHGAHEVLKWLHSNQHKLQYKTLLGYFYLHDIGTEIDLRKAYNLYLAAAKKDYPIAQYLLGECYSSGVGTKTDEKLAFQWYQKAAEVGNANGLNWVGYCYEFGKGTERDINKAFNCYKKSTRQGNMLGMHFLADCYEKGKGTPKNRDQAIYWYRKAADHGNEGSLTVLNKLLRATNSPPLQQMSQFPNKDIPPITKDAKMPNFPSSKEEAEEE
ncbi:14162_t:CDS:2 [Acaulospora colombiana]|uniref:14162_t:CDS:1 n=1 Tax=Acaulospora colombiana TaxID=27376 RepID=A0ACA9LQ35_9GLOM|nr:14162_t:CDS:2 [Acaulospora colombiana]